jgi:hypothetical protein
MVCFQHYEISETYLRQQPEGGVPWIVGTINKNTSLRIPKKPSFGRSLGAHVDFSIFGELYQVDGNQIYCSKSSFDALISIYVLSL